jgi:hypothetical protein
MILKVCKLPLPNTLITNTKQARIDRGHHDNRREIPTCPLGGHWRNHSFDWGLYFASSDKATPIGPIVFTLAAVTQPVAAVVSYFHLP